MKSPKERFQETPQAGPFAEMSVSTPFQTAADYAMLEFVFGLGVAGDSVSAAAKEWQLEGAKAFLRTFAALADRPKGQAAPARGLNFNPNKPTIPQNQTQT